MQRPPYNTPANIEDFRASGWKDTVGAAEATYVSRWLALSAAATTATTAGNLARGRILWLLADACSLRLIPDNQNEPLIAESATFGPRFSLSNIDEKDMALLESICPELVDVPILQARVADILWLARTPRGKFTDALLAIDAYRRTHLDSDAWFTGDSRNCWHRALSLAWKIGKSCEDRRNQMKDALLTAITAQFDSGNAAPAMIETLLDHGLADDQYQALGDRLVEQANRLIATDASYRFLKARNHLRLAQRCFDPQQNPDRCADIDCAISDTFAADPDGHPKLLHLWPVKLLQAERCRL